MNNFCEMKTKNKNKQEYLINFWVLEKKLRSVYLFNSVKRIILLKSLKLK